MAIRFIEESRAAAALALAVGEPAEQDLAATGRAEDQPAEQQALLTTLPVLDWICSSLAAWPADQLPSIATHYACSIRVR